MSFLQMTGRESCLDTKLFLYCLRDRHNVELESASAANYPGVTIADDLSVSWSPHIDNTTKKANQTLGFLKRNIQVDNKDLKSAA